MSDSGWVACPVCKRAARLEAGGTRGVVCGHSTTFRRVLPALTGSDWKNRLRMRALDTAFTAPGLGAETPIRLLEKLEEGMHRPIVSSG